MSSVALPAATGAKAKRSAREVVVAAALPEPAEKLILHVVRRTRLWRREQAEVAEELVAHFRDGLDAGRTAEDLVGTFGDPALAAKLIRRGKKRNRPRWWRVGRRVAWGTAVFVLLWAAASLALATRRPRVSVDYLAELNRRLPEAPPEQQAWPVYRAALLADPLEGVDLFTPIKLDAAGNPVSPQPRDERGLGLGPDGKPIGPMPIELRPKDPAWPVAVALLQEHRVLLEAAREGGRKQAFGLKALPPSQYSAQDRKALPPWLRDAPAGSALNVVRWNELWHPLGTMAHLLAMDSWLAAAEGDGERVAANHRAMLGMARQAGERSFWFSLHVSLGICNVANQTLAEVEQAYPGLLDGRRVPVLHEMAGASGLFTADFTGERLFLLDVVQRTFSDDGCGDGTLTYAGLRASLEGLEFPPNARRPEPPLDEKALTVAALPAAAVLGASRKEAVEKLDLYWKAAEWEFARPMWQRLRSPSETDTSTQGWYRPLHMYRNLPLSMLLEPVGPLAMKRDESRALHEATMTALALGVWRERHRAYPPSLAELVPQYLPQLPVDHSSGAPLRYKLQDGRPLLYGVGKDGKDDGGAQLGDARRWPEAPGQGDWVLYPPINPR